MPRFYGSINLSLPADPEVKMQINRQQNVDGGQILVDRPMLAAGRAARSSATSLKNEATWPYGRCIVDLASVLVDKSWPPLA